jgi:hypothetical protein
MVDVSGIIDVRDILHYSDIIKNENFITDDGCHRILVIKYEGHLWYAHMHNGNTIDLSRLD